MQSRAVASLGLRHSLPKASTLSQMPHQGEQDFTPQHPLPGSTQGEESTQPPAQPCTFISFPGGVCVGGGVVVVVPFQLLPINTQTNLHSPR